MRVHIEPRFLGERFSLAHTMGSHGPRPFLGLCFVTLLLCTGWATLSTADLPVPPGPEYRIPEGKSEPGVAEISAWTDDAGPDETFLIVGHGLTENVIMWGPSPTAEFGVEIRPKVQFCNGQIVAVTIPERSYDGPYVVWVENGHGRSRPFVLNAPQTWWCHPRNVFPGGVLRVFGRNLARRPHYAEVFAWLEPQTGPGRWLKAQAAGKYAVTLHIPDDLAPGVYRLVFHAGAGGRWGWSQPLTFEVKPRPPQLRSVVLTPGADLQQAVDGLAGGGGGILELPEGRFLLQGTLIIPTGVQIKGQGRGRTVLQAPESPRARFPRFYASAWNQGPAGVHTPGDTMTYKVTLPRAGRWTVWLRYATDMSPWGQPGVSGRMTVRLNNDEPVVLENLPNTGSFGTFRWSRSAELTAAAGENVFVWKNERGGGIHIDAFVFSDDPRWQPEETAFPQPGPNVIIVQAEDVLDFQTKEGSLPGNEKACVWLAGDGAGIKDLTILGSVQTNLGIVVRHRDFPRWIRGCEVEDVEVRDCQGKQAENCGVRLFRAEASKVVGCELWARSPLFLSGVRQCELSHNRLVSVTLWGGNAEGYINGRNEPVEECIIEDNVCGVPPGMEGGGPTGRRMIWLSTGRGSVTHNWIAENREDRAVFGGVAGTDQNVGEMILFEACQRIAYFGPIERAETGSITVPAHLPETPAEWLGDVKREDLPRDAEGRETPFWPPEEADEREPGVTEYYITVLDGPAWGQTRRIIARDKQTYLVDQPWRVVPPAGSRVVIATAFYQNHLVNNRTVNGMTGIQLWISCIGNILSGNQIARQRKPAVFLYGTCTTLASSMPMTWNRGIGPLFFNHVEGTEADEASCGILLITGERPDLPLLFPHALGNVLRHNGLHRNRTEGAFLVGNRPSQEDSPYRAVMGTIVEFNLVRDALRAYRSGSSVEGTVFRRNHAYFWYPVNTEGGERVAFQIDDPESTSVLEHNSVEGISGVLEGGITPVKRGDRVEDAGSQ